MSSRPRKSHKSCCHNSNRVELVSPNCPDCSYRKIRCRRRLVGGGTSTDGDDDDNDDEPDDHAVLLCVVVVVVVDVVLLKWLRCT